MLLFAQAKSAACLPPTHLHLPAIERHSPSPTIAHPNDPPLPWLIRGRPCPEAPSVCAARPRDRNRGHKNEKVNCSSTNEYRDQGPRPRAPQAELRRSNGKRKFESPKPLNCRCGALLSWRNTAPLKFRPLSNSSATRQCRTAADLPFVPPIDPPPHDLETFRSATYLRVSDGNRRSEHRRG